MNSQSKFRFDGKTVPLASLCIEIIDCHHSTPNWTENGKLVIRNFNIRNGRLHLDNIFYTDEETFKERIRRSKPEPGDLIITREAPMGEVCVIPDYVECCLGQRMVLIKPDSKKVSSKYLLYALQSEFVQKQIQKSDKTGSIVSNLRIPVIKELLIPSFDIKIEQRIGDILDAIVSKIELNNRINAELEAMAKTIYDYWFVQFDFPDKKGKPYKASDGKMVWSDELKREIPEGWDDGQLKDIANITMGQSPAGESYNEDGNGMIFFQGCTDFGNRFPSVRQFTTAPTRYAKEGDILLSVRAPVGTLNIAKDDCCIGRGLAALNSRDNCISYLFGVMINLKQIFDRRNVDGTTFGSITKDDLFSLQVVRPDKATLLRFNEIVNPIFQKQNKIELENQKLTELRDWLLPMLMNGQIKIKDAERLSSEALTKDEESSFAIGTEDKLARAAEPETNYRKKK